MDEDKSKRLQLTLWELQKRWGDNIITNRADAATALRTGFDALDAILSSGGLPRGRLTVLSGMPTSGMTTVALRVIAQAQTEQGTAAYIDLSRTFDPDYAVRCGVALERLLIVRPRHITQAFEVARDLFKADQLTLVVLDLATESPRQMTSSLRQMHERLTKSRSVALMLVASSWDGLDALTYIQLQVTRQAWLHQAQDVAGYRVQITVLKDKSNPGEKQITLDLQIGGDGA